MKRVLSLFALGLLAGCATYPDYGYYDDGRSYDGYASRDYYEDRYRDGGDYYYSNRPYYSYDDGFYGYGPYGYGYGGYSGYGGYGYGLGGYGGSLGYGFGYRPRIGLGFGFSSGGYYPYGGYYGGYPFGYSGFSNYYAPRRPYHYDRYDDRSENRWRDSRGRYGGRGDGVTHDDASDLASEIARQRGVSDSSAAARSARSYDSYARDRDPALDNRNGWRSGYREAQLASPRAAAAGNAYSRDAAPQWRIEQAPTREWRGRPQERQQNTPRFESAPQQNYATPRFHAAPQQQSYAAPRSESAPQRFSQPAAAPRFESRSESATPRSSAREREATNEP